MPEASQVSMAPQTGFRMVVKCQASGRALKQNSFKNIGWGLKCSSMDQFECQGTIVFNNTFCIDVVYGFFKNCFYLGEWNREDKILWDKEE